MYATLPSVDATISCGSVPAGTRATTLMLAGSTIAIVLSLFSSTSNAGDGVCANVDAAPASSSAAVAHISRSIFGHRTFAVILDSLLPSDSRSLGKFAPAPQRSVHQHRIS